MGQYHKLINLDKREAIQPHGLGLGLKQYEHTGCKGSLADAMYLLVMTSPQRGGGDWEYFDGLSGRWAGDRVVIIGDYTSDGDLPDYPNAGNLYLESDGWKDLTAEVATALGKVWDFEVIGDGWKDRVSVE
jgi:hypothetical protein